LQARNHRVVSTPNVCADQSLLCMRWCLPCLLTCSTLAERPISASSSALNVAVEDASDGKLYLGNSSLKFLEADAFLTDGVEENKEVVLALLVAVSSRGSGKHLTKAEDCDFFQALFPSFLATTSPGDGFRYAFYVAFDVDDPFYDSRERRNEFEGLFLTRAGYKQEDSLVFDFKAPKARAQLHWVSVAPYVDGETGPVRAWNSAFQEAFSDGAAYFYQLGDDIRFVTKGWSRALVDQLHTQGDVGIVGGREINYQAGNELMPCVMTSRAHMSIFGSFFPTRMHNWWSDNWILEVYKPFRLATKVEAVEIENTHATSRYEVSNGDMWISQDLQDMGKEEVSKYLRLIGRHVHFPGDVLVMPTSSNRNEKTPC